MILFSLLKMFQKNKNNTFLIKKKYAVNLKIFTYNSNVNYLKKIFTFVLINYLNIVLFRNSKYIDIEQVLLDIEKLNLENLFNELNIYMMIGFVVTSASFLLNSFFKPFIEIYIQHYLRYSFYILINLLSISTVFIAFRIYGYSRGLLLVYLISSSFIFYLDDKNYLVGKIQSSLGR